MIRNVVMVELEAGADRDTLAPHAERTARVQFKL